MPGDGALLRIEMLGTRGVPASYSGFETCVETSEVGGTHPALLEPMAAGSCVVVNDTPENLETIADAGFSYHGDMGAGGLRTVLERFLKDPALVAEQGRRGLERVRAHYSWDGVTDSYERLFRELLEETR